jgi:tetratricopeptide (TPR) repeat protein
MCSRWASLLVLMHIASFGRAATAQTLDEQPCSASNPDLMISGCTAVIQSGDETPPNLAIALNKRGNAYLDKGQYDRAIQDFDQAIRLNPNYAGAFNNRGHAYDEKGQPDRAIQDYDQAIRLGPNFVVAFSNRGLAKRAKGDSAGGDADIAKAKQLNLNAGAPTR